MPRDIMAIFDMFRLVYASVAVPNSGKLLAISTGSIRVPSVRRSARPHAPAKGSPHNRYVPAAVTALSLLLQAA